MKPKTEPKKNGRPSSFEQKVADLICLRLADGESLRSICRDDSMPGMSTVFRWLADEKLKGFREQYAHAREVGLETMADEILEIADETSRDTLVNSKGDEMANSEWIARSKVRIDTRKWLLSKQLPKKYGDRTVLAGDPDNPLMEPLDDTQRAAKLQAILATAQARKAKNGGGV
jgi:hypothetical protein